MNERGTRRLSLAISEGDGISVLVEVAAPEAARAAEEQGADGVVVRKAGASVRDATELPILWCSDGPDAADAAGADACRLVAHSYGEDWQRLADDLARGFELGLDSVVEVHDEEELQATLEHVDPEIFLLGGESPDPDAAAIDHVLELLPDVPAGKLAVAYLPDATHDEVEALERAGVDAVVVNASDVRELVGAEPPQSEPESRWGGPATILGLVLVGAAALRLVGVRYGLPDGGLLNPDEELVVPRAWAMTHGDGFDPNPFFDWPSLLLYVQAPFQAWHDSPSYLTARIVGVVIGLAGVASAWWLGERSCGVLAGGVAAVATAVAGVHVAYSRMAVTDVLLTTLVTVALGLLVTRRYELAGLVIGAATAAKWPGALVLVPLAVAAWGQWRRLAYAGGLALAGFVVASPFAVVHLGEAASDWWRGLSRARDGSLGGDDDSFSAVAFTSHLWDALGPALVVALIGLAVALARRDRADRVLASFVAVYFLALLPLGSHLDRYVLPLVPVLGVLAGRFRSFAPVTLLLLVVPFAWTVRDTRELTETGRGAAMGAIVEREVGGAAAPGPWASVHRLPSRR